MDIVTRHEGEATILALSGDITLYNTPEVRKSILSLLKDKRVPALLVDMRAVRYIDSSGVASLVEGLKASRDMGSRFALYGLTKTTREVLELTRLVRVFEVYETEQQALTGNPAGQDTARGAGNRGR
ncbi:MAG TPA: STAS domain-containing protein [Candidatus Acidoferrales bacterium]|nr:STAS domain-containing protein [Candidatus Acidoferrales bacterium]